ncbi:MAG: Uma2 family endonuclease [Planctomycetota bacterium]
MSSLQLYDRVGPFVTPSNVTTIDGFRAWASSDTFPETGKVAFVEGRLYFDMSPERIDLHTTLKGEVSLVLSLLVRDEDLGHFYPDGVLLTNKAAGVSNEPDASFASWATLESGRLTHPDTRGDRFVDLVGTPDWVCEVVSGSSEEKDLRILREAYYKAGIPEYWLIDAWGSEIDFKLLVAGDDGYEEAVADKDGWRRSLVFDREFYLSRSRDRVNRWRYRLDQR